jgi:hypothetical protein
MYFTRKCDGPSIESFIKERKSPWEEIWPHWVDLKLQGDAAIWWKSLDYKEMMTLSNGEFEKILLDNPTTPRPLTGSIKNPLLLSRSGSLDSLRNHCENLTHRSFSSPSRPLHRTVTNFPHRKIVYRASGFRYADMRESPVIRIPDPPISDTPLLARQPLPAIPRSM